MRVRIDLQPEGDESPASPIPVGVIFGGPLLDCQNGTAKLRGGMNELVLPFRQGGWEWRAGRSSLPEWGPFALEKIGPVKWIMLMLTGQGRKDRGTMWVKSVVIERWRPSRRGAGSDERGNLGERGDRGARPGLGL